MQTFTAVCIFFLVLQWLAAIGRCAVRLFIVRRFAADDFSMLCTLALSSAFSACLIVIAMLSDSQVFYDVPTNKLLQALQTTLAMEILYVLGAASLKVSIGLLLLRVLIKRWQIHIIYVTMAIPVLYSIAYAFLLLFQCGNPDNFVIKIAVSQCMSISVINGTSYAHAVLNALADCVFAILPVALLWDAEMSRRSKWGVAAVLSLGSVGCVCTVVRIGYIHTLSYATPTWFETTHAVGELSSAELAIGVTCLSLCTYRPLLSLIFYKGYYYRSSSHVSTPHETRESETWQRLQDWRNSPSEELAGYDTGATTLTSNRSANSGTRAGDFQKFDFGLYEESAKA